MLKIESLESNHQNSEEDSSPQNWLDSMSAADADIRTITKLTPGVKDHNRVNVFINGRFALSLDVKQIVDLGIKVGKKLTPEELQELHKASEFGKLYQRSLEWAFSRPHSLRETRDYLKRRQLKRTQLNRKRISEELKPLPEIQDSAIELVIERLQERGYIDDRKFAEYYVENRFIKKGVSKTRLRLELVKKGVSEEIIVAVLNDSSRTDQDELAKMIAKKSKKYDEQKLIAYLMRQGFRYHEVIEAVNKYKHTEG